MYECRLERLYEKERLLSPAPSSHLSLSHAVEVTRTCVGDNRTTRTENKSDVAIICRVSLFFDSFARSSETDW